MRKNKTALFLAAVSLSAFFAVSSPGAQEDASRFVDGTRINSVGVGGLTGGGQRTDPGILCRRIRAFCHKKGREQGGDPGRSN